MIVACLTITVCLSGCLKKQPVTKSGFAFDTIISVTIYASDEADNNALLEEAFALCEKYDALFSISDPQSDIYRLNHADGKSVTVSEETYDLLEKAIAYGDLSGGLLDVTIQPVYALWDFEGNDAPVLPDHDALKAAVQKVDYHNIRLLQDHRVALENNAEVNLGAIAKGYIADRIKEHLVNAGVTSALINLGGNVLVIGEKPGKTPFQIGIETPFDQTGAILTSVSVKDRSVVTSGIYQRCFTVQDKLYHHILDPTTGYPKDTDLNAAVIITSSSVDADAYSTICMLLGRDAAKEFLSQLHDVDFLLIDRDNVIDR